MSQTKHTTVEARTRRAYNTAAQAIYRKRHGEQLRLARQVGSVLMGLHSRGYYRNCGIPHLARRLRAFLTPEELAALRRELRGGRPAKSLDEIAETLTKGLAAIGKGRRH